MEGKRSYELKPCPFCDGKAHINMHKHGWWPVADHSEECVLYGIEPPENDFFCEERLAAKAWNTRKGD